MSLHGETRRIVVAPVGEMVAAFCLALVGAAKAGISAMGTMKRAIERRRILSELARCDDHMLHDMGITRADLRDAASAPMMADPTCILGVRAGERRAAARIAARGPGAG